MPVSRTGRARSTRASRARAASKMARSSSVGRVERRPARDEREVRVLHLERDDVARAARPRAAAARPAPPARAARARALAAPARSSPKVSSAPTLFAASSGTTSRGSSPRRERRAGRGPRVAPTAAGERRRPAVRARSPMVATPIRRSASSVTGPTPQSRADRQRREEGGDAARRHLDEAVRLAEVGRDLGGELHLGDRRPRPRGRTRPGPRA